MDFILSLEHEMMKKSIAEFVEKEIRPGAAERDEKEEFTLDLFYKMAGCGLTGIPWPEAYGGAGSDYLSYIIAVEEISKVDASAGITLSTHTSLCSWPIYEYGTEEQKQKYLAPLAKGEKLGAFGLTEPSAGSDAGAMQTTAVLEGDHYVLNGCKHFISNAGYAEIYVIFAYTDKSKKTKGISAFILEKEMPGFTFGKKEKKLGIRSSATGELIFENVRVPKEKLLGSEGDGFKIAMATLDGGRNGVAAQALGISAGAYEEAKRYAKEREQFGQNIANFQAISFKLADMATRVDAARLMTYRAAVLKDKGLPYAKESAMSKLYASDTAMDIAVEAVQILGGYGFTRDFPLERYMRDAKITQIYEGTNEIHRLVIGRYVLSED
ncbi:MAG: acyl-CoA dehydrogenase [Bacillota bacterium]